jgi:hypothetical protein
VEQDLKWGSPLHKLSSLQAKESGQRLNRLTGGARKGNNQGHRLKQIRGQIQTGENFYFDSMRMESASIASRPAIRFETAALQHGAGVATGMDIVLLGAAGRR